MYTNWCRYKWVNTTLALSTGPEHLFTLLAERPCQWPSWPTGREQKLLSPGINLWGEVISPRVPRRIHQPRETKDSTCGQNPYGSQSQSQEEPVDIKSRWRHNWKSAQVVNSHLVHDPTIRQPGFDLPRQQWSMLNRFRTKQGHCGACRRKWRLTDTDLCPCGETQSPRRCLTLSNPVPWQNWMAAYLGYTLCRWRRCFVADQLWLMKRIREESLLLADVRNFVFFVLIECKRKSTKRQNCKWAETDASWQEAGAFAPCQSRDRVFFKHYIGHVSQPTVFWPSRPTMWKADPQGQRTLVMSGQTAAAKNVLSITGSALPCANWHFIVMLQPLPVATRLFMRLWFACDTGRYTNLFDWLIVDGRGLANRQHKIVIGNVYECK